MAAMQQQPSQLEISYRPAAQITAQWWSEFLVGKDLYDKGLPAAPNKHPWPRLSDQDRSSRLEIFRDSIVGDILRSAKFSGDLGITISWRYDPDKTLDDALLKAGIYVANKSVLTHPQTRTFLHRVDTISEFEAKETTHIKPTALERN